MKTFIVFFSVALILFFMILPASTDKVLESYTIGGEVSGIHYQGKYNNQPVISVRGKGFATTFSLSNEEAARYCVGDIVVVEIQEKENLYGKYTIYNFVG